MGRCRELDHSITQLAALAHRLGSARTPPQHPPCASAPQKHSLEPQGALPLCRNKKG